MLAGLLGLLLAVWRVVEPVPTRAGRRARTSHEPPRFPPGPGLHVVVITDWTDLQRGVFWQETLKELQPRIATSTVEYPIADAPTHPFLLEPANVDVLVVNWDAVNGDPAFGANHALRCVASRRLPILAWVAQGGVLIIEGQARDHLPDPDAYAAVVGPGELPVCGLENELDPREQDSRNGTMCRMTRAARRSPLFQHLHLLRPFGAPRTNREMFPDGGDQVVSVDLADADWSVLYRGWFRRRLLGRRRLPWVALARTADRSRGSNYPTLLAARYGSGAIFASTMMLTSTRQRRLIAAMLRTHGRTSDLPDPPHLARLWQRLSGPVSSLVATPLAAALAGGVTLAASSVNTVAAVLVGGVTAAVPLGFRALRRIARTATGR